jgi:cobalamin biosynthesis protein CobC
MNTAAFTTHGGRMHEARAQFPHAPEPWIDLSTGINPRSYPAPRPSKEQRNRLPGCEELKSLEQAAALAFGIDDAARVVATAGSESALRLLPQLLALKEAAIASPTYGSHAQSWRSAKPVALDLLLPQAARARQAVIIVNPNNPDGRIVGASELRSLHDALASQGGALIVDEAFADTVPAISVAALAGSAAAPRLLVLRSFGKFYGLAGLRLGFLVAAAPIAAALRSVLGDWPVSVDALLAGRAAYADSAWSERERQRLTRDARRLDHLLTRAGFSIVGGTSLYRLVSAPDAATRFRQLLQAGVLTRPFAADATLLRFGLPGSAAAWRRLSSALRVA